MLYLESSGISADTTAHGEFLTSWRMGDLQGTFITIEFLCSGTNRALREILLLCRAEARMIVVARIAEMSGTKTEPKGDTTAETASKLKVVSSVFGADLATADKGLA